MDDVLARVDAQFGYPRPDRRGERWVPCPLHGERRRNSFSYSTRGYNCFACGAAGGLRKLAELLGLGSAAPLTMLRPLRARRPARRAPETPERPWQRDPRILERFQPIPPEGLAYAYSRGLTDESIRRWRIGWGMLPASRARFPRLILPVIECGRVVGLRGRAVDPRDNAPKWLQSAGSKTTLFGAETLGEGKIVIVTEAPLSAILAIQEHSEIATVIGDEISAVASTAGCATWREEWTDLIAASRPAAVVVWMDHDEAGLAAAVRVGNALAARHLPVHRYRWPSWAKPKEDLADVVVSCRGA